MKNIFFKLMNNAAFGKTMKNVRKHRDIKLFITKPNFHTTVFHRKFISNKNEKNRNIYVDIESFIVYIKKKIFIKIWQKMLKLHFILQIIN